MITVPKHELMNPKITFRRKVREDDRLTVRKILESSGFFHDFEVDVAISLVDEALQQGEACGYIFLFSEENGQTTGYSCFGDIPCTKNSYDIYWIAVSQDQRGKGTGGLLLKETERLISEMKGNGIYLETSSMEKYLPTRNFYLKYGYKIEAVIRDFYDYGDDKVIFVKRLNPS
jgi:ribosomal protein S18 acetylase RimI-like enzyme